MRKKRLVIVSVLHFGKWLQIDQVMAVTCRDAKEMVICNWGIRDVSGVRARFAK